MAMNIEAEQEQLELIFTPDDTKYTPSFGLEGSPVSLSVMLNKRIDLELFESLE